MGGGRSVPFDAAVVGLKPQTDLLMKFDSTTSIPKCLIKYFGVVVDPCDKGSVRSCVRLAAPQHD
jgi:hypothetical protein